MVGSSKISKLVYYKLLLNAANIYRRPFYVQSVYPGSGLYYLLLIRLFVINSGANSTFFNYRNNHIIIIAYL